MHFPMLREKAPRKYDRKFRDYQKTMMVNNLLSQTSWGGWRWADALRFDKYWIRNTNTNSRKNAQKLNE